MSYMELSECVYANAVAWCTITTPLFACSTKVIETPAMLELMQEKPFLAQKLMLASASVAPKRKADQIS